MTSFILRIKLSHDYYSGLLIIMQTLHNFIVVNKGLYPLRTCSDMPCRRCCGVNNRVGKKVHEKMDFEKNLSVLQTEPTLRDVYHWKKYPLYNAKSKP